MIKAEIEIVKLANDIVTESPETSEYTCTVEGGLD